MALPVQERFTIEDLAARWGKSPAYVDELIRSCQFDYIIICGEIAGSPLTRHVYFNPGLWNQHYGRKIKARRDKINADTERYWKTAKTFDGKLRQPPSWWLKERLDRRKRKPEKETSYDIGPYEVANLVVDPSTWKRPQDGQTVIPRSTIEAFEQRHSVENAEKEPITDVCEIKSTKWYSARQAARFLGRSYKYVLDSIIPMLKEAGAKKRGSHGQWEIPGHAIISYREKYSKGETSP